MATVTLKKEYNSKEEDIFNSFQNLEADKARLSEQKEHLTALLNQLENKAKEEYEKRKRKLEKLDSEVNYLKQRCAKFTIFIDSQSSVECTQPGT
jgi:chromosome segregation ATPase